MENCDSVEGLSFDIWTAASVGDLDFIRQSMSPDESIDIVNRGGWTCLMYASYYDHSQLVAFLVSCGSNVHFGSKTALMLAASCGLIETLRVLIHVGDALENEPSDEQGYTALFHAVSSDHYETCRLLLEAGSRIDVKDVQNQSTMLQIACQDGHERIVDLLLRHGSDPLYKNKNGDNAGDLALKNGHERLARYLKEFTQKHARVWEGPVQVEKMMQQRKSIIPFDLDLILNELHLEKYKDRFENVPLDKFMTLTDEDLKDLGISLLGPRRKLTRAIEHLNVQYFSSNN